MTLPLLSLLMLAAPPPAHPPPNWTVMPAPLNTSTARIAWSADGRRIALCGSESVGVLEAQLKPIIIAPHRCTDIAFDGADVVYATQHDDQIGVWRSRPKQTSPQRLTRDVARALLVRNRRLWIAGKDLTIRENGKLVARAALSDVRRLVSTPAGVLAVTWRTIVLLDDALKIVRTFAPEANPKANLYDAVGLPDGRVAGVANGGDVWIWDATGRQAAHGRKIGNANWLLWTGSALVVGQMWLQVDPLRPTARATHQPRSIGPAALSPDGTRIAIALHQGVLVRDATQTVHVPRGMPATARGIVTTPGAVWVADDNGQLVHLDRQGAVQAVYPLATGGLRDLVGDPAKALYAATEWGDVIAWRPAGPYRRWASRSAESLALSADGTTIYAGGQKTIDRFDTRTGARTAMAEMPKDYGTFRPTLTPDGDVIWFRRGHPAVWHPKGKAPVSILSGSSGAFDARGRLWVNDQEQKPGLYTWPKRSKIKRLPWMEAGRFVPLADGGMVVTGWSGQVQAFNPDGAELWSKHAPWHVGGVALLTDPKRGDRVLTGGPDLTLSSWNLKTGARTAWVPPGRGQRVSGMAFSADGRVLAVGADSTGVRVWDLKTHRMVRDLAVTDGDVAVNRDGNEWLIHQYARVHRWPVAGGAARAVALREQFNSSRGTGAGGAFALRQREAQAHVVDLRSGKTLWTVAVPEAVRTIVMSHDGHRVAMLVPDEATQGELTQVRVQVRGKGVQQTVKGPISDLRWHGETLLAWQEEGAFEWRPKGLQRRPDLPRLSGRMASAGTRLAVSDEAVVRVHDGLKHIATLPVELNGGAHIRLSPDGKVLAVGGTFTGSVVLWSVDTGRAIARYEAFADGLWRSTTAAGRVATGKTIRARP